MLGFEKMIGTLCLASLFGAAVHAVNPVEIKGQDFVDATTNKRLMIIGIDYQPGGQAAYNPNVHQDVLSNGTVCLRDAALLQRLGVNTIRVYNLDPLANHDDCASIFNTAGIYMILDVNSPQASINRADPASSYNTEYLTRIFGMVEAFKAYPNTLAFFGANEVINDVASAKFNPPYIRAVQRDLRNYIAKNSPREIAVGYSAADVRDVLKDTWAYLQCSLNGTASDMSRSQFFGLNSYSWCGGDATFQSAGYDQLVSLFQESSIPVFFSEYGCNKIMPRVFNEVQALYGPQMTSLSGGLVYEYSQEESNYGLVILQGDGSVRLRTDFDNLQNQYNKLNITLLESASASGVAITPPACSSSLISSNGFGTSFTIPSPPSGAQALIDNGLSNANRGKLVAVNSLAVTLPVYGSNGGAITGLAVKPVSGSNTPGGESTKGTGNSTTSTNSTASTPKKAGASTMASISVWAQYFWAGMAVASCMLLL